MKKYIFLFVIFLSISVYSQNVSFFASTKYDPSFQIDEKTRHSNLISFGGGINYHLNDNFPVYFGIQFYYSKFKHMDGRMLFDPDSFPGSQSYDVGFLGELEMLTFEFPVIYKYIDYHSFYSSMGVKFGFKKLVESIETQTLEIQTGASYYGTTDRESTNFYVSPALELGYSIFETASIEIGVEYLIYKPKLTYNDFNFNIEEKFNYTGFQFTIGLRYFI